MDEAEPPLPARGATAALLAAAAVVASSPGALGAGPTDPAPAAPPWQQGVDYRIEARLDEGTDVLRGRARLRYANASPDTLRSFYVHLYLNAFRPNSAWARDDLRRGRRTFQELGPDEHAFQRIHAARFDGTAVEPRFPHAPDSTVVRFDLPRPLPPGDTITADLDWTARTSTVPRRQGRRGRQYDFAQWYPRVAVYDLEGWAAHPLYRQGEFYGEFATYDVTLEVRDDQVLGATGVPVRGDPGWEGARAPGVGDVDHQRGWYGAGGGPPCVERRGERICGVPPAEMLRREEPLGLLEGDPGPGMKRVRWYAEDVHHFAWSTSPEYIYEEGSYEDVVIRVLYRPGDEDRWGGGIAVRRTATALRWLDTIFGDYPWPQLTNLHRIEGGGTEFPMVIMDGSASRGLIVHEAGHQYVHGILANNEWAAGWLDEGLSSFQDAWFDEAVEGRGRGAWLGTEMSVILSDLRGESEPVVLPAEHYAEYSIYSRMIYSRGSLVFRMLRDMAGRERMIELLRRFYDEYRFRHVDEDAFRHVAESVLRRDLDWFFGEWLHGTGVVNYALDDVEVEARDDGGWSTAFTVERTGDLIMPVPVRLAAGEEAVDTVVPGTPRRLRTSVRTSFRPTSVDLDPRGEILDWNALDDRWEGGSVLDRPKVVELDDPLGPEPRYRDALRVGWLPLAWYGDAGGVTVGAQRRANYMGELHRTVLRVGAPGFEVEGIDAGGDSDGQDPGSLYLRAENPIVGPLPRFGLRVEALAGEGRLAVSASREADVSPLPVSGPRRAWRAFASVVGTYDRDYLRPFRYDLRKGVTAEAGVGSRARVGRRTRRGGLDAALDVALAAGFTGDGREYGRARVEADVVRRVGSRGRLALRLFLGAVETLGPEDVPRERLFFLSGADPYRLLGNPLLRSAGAPLVRSAGWYHAPGGGNLRGYHPVVGGDGIAALNAEVGARFVGSRRGRGRGLRLELALFADGGWAAMAPAASPGAPERIGPGIRFGSCGGGTIGVRPDAVDPGTPCLFGTDGAERLLADAGVGLGVGLPGSGTRLRIDLPVWVSDPALAAQAKDDELGLRATLSVESAVGF